MAKTLGAKDKHVRNNTNYIARWKKFRQTLRPNKMLCPCGTKESTPHFESCPNIIYNEAGQPEPFFFRTYCCARCFEFLPELFMLEDEQWSIVCGAVYPLTCILCFKCCQHIFNTRYRFDHPEPQIQQEEAQS